MENNHGDYDNNGNKLNIYKKVHLFFYTYTSTGDLLLLLHRDKNLTNNLMEFTTDILPLDDLPTYAISRIMATTYRGLFTDNNIEKISTNQEITEKDLQKDEFLWYTIWDNEVFHLWLEKISQNHIQFDSIQGVMVYLIPIPIIEMEGFNKNLEKLDYQFRFEYIKWGGLDGVGQNLRPESFKLMKLFDFDNHIQTTTQMFKEDKVDYYLILACKKQGTKKDQAGFFNFPALIPTIYRKNHEKWVYSLASSDLPTDDILRKTKAIIIPGSELNIYLDLEFLRLTESWIKQVMVNYPNIKFLGICFGMQLYISAIGGVVEKIPPGDIFISKGEKLEILDEFWDFKFVKNSGLEKRKNMFIRQSHMDHVVTFPAESGLKNYAFSDSCKMEMIVSEDERVLCIQGHPEYALEFYSARVAPFMCTRRKLEPTVENLIQVREKIISDEQHVVDASEFRKICYSFLKN